MLATNQQKEFKEGIFKNIDIEDYHKSQGISSSGIKLLLNSPKKYHYQYLSGLYIHKDKKAMVAGTALHLLVLEPSLFEKTFYVMKDKIDRRTTVGKEAYAKALEECGNRKVLTLDEFNEISSMAYAVKSNKPFVNAISKNGNIEDSIYFQDECGALLRARPDFYNDFLIIDIKTTRDASPEGFQRSVLEYGYHIQAAMQQDALRKTTGREYKHFCHLVVEDEAPYLTGFYRLDDYAIDLGRAEYKRGAQTYKKCLEFDDWPGYDENIQTISLPDWYLRRQQ